MTKKDAEIFFDVVLKHPELFWKANNTGCEAKADLVAELAFQMGFKVNKIWIRPLSSSDSFLVYLNEAGTEFTAWNYHVAAAVEVNDTSNTETLIIDPTLFEKPITLEFWHKRLSRLSNQYNVILEKKQSKREAFFSPEDFLTSSNREKALAKREEILTNSSDLNDPIVFDGFMMKLRGAFVDKLMVAELERFQNLKVMLRNNEFKKWFQKPITNDKLKSQLSNQNFYGIESSIIKNSIDLSLIEASVNLKEIYWEQIGKAFRKLTDRSQQLLNGGFNTETLTFKIDWEEDYFRQSWYASNSEDLWAKYGISIEDLQN